MKGEDPARRRVGIGMIAEQQFGAGRHIFEADLPVLAVHEAVHFVPLKSGIE